MDKYITCTDAEYAVYCKEDTNRKLLKGYREAKEHKEDIERIIAIQPGRMVPLYLGYPAYRVLNDTKRRIKAYEYELKERGYKLEKIKLKPCAK